MPLELIVDSLEGVDEAAKPLYVERGGKFHLDVNGLPDTTRLSRALESERTKAADLDKRLKAFSGVDPEKYQKLVQEAADREAADAERERKAAESRGEYERLTKEQAEAHQKAIANATEAQKKIAADKDAEIAALRTSMQRDKLDAEAIRAITSLKGVPELLLPHVKSVAQVVERNGTMVVEVLDGEGKPRVNAAGAPLTLPELVDEMKKSPIFSRAFEAEGTRGTGSGNGTGGGGGTFGTFTQEQIEKMPLSEYRKAREEGKIA